MPEYTGRTVKEAIEIGLQDLNLSESEATITIVEEGHTGVFGLGSKPALVQVVPKGLAETPEMTASDAASDVALTPEPALDAVPPMTEQIEMSMVANMEPEETSDDDGDEADMPIPLHESEHPEVLKITANFLQTMLELMGLNARVDATVLPADEEDNRDNFYLNIAGDDLGILIGRRAETLDAIQYLVRMVAHRHSRRWPNIEVDVEHYKQRRERNLQRLAESMADKAVREQRTIVLEAMPARERRLVHIALRDRSDVFTQSIGEDDNRKVTIVPS